MLLFKSWGKALFVAMNFFSVVVWGETRLEKLELKQFLSPEFSLGDSQKIPYYRCPGDSFLTGLKMAIDAKSNEHRFLFRCTFFEDQDLGKVIRKESLQSAPNPKQEGSRGYKYGETPTQSVCKNQLQAIDGLWVSSLADPKKQRTSDLVFTPFCADLKTRSEACKEYPVAPLHSFEILCPNSMVWSRLQTTFQPEGRGLTVTCCPVVTTGLSQ